MTTTRNNDNKSYGVGYKLMTINQKVEGTSI